jgi:glycosyltransferase involved in cell wall biosynthesis
MTIYQAKIPNLEIAIPTYNRPKQLARLLQSILLQDCSEYLQRIIVSVYDNSTDVDQTAKKLLSALAEKGSITAYVKNPQNIGGAANIAQAYAKASAQWSIVVGDDDYFMPYSIGRILCYIEECSAKGIGLIQYGFICIDDQFFAKFRHPTAYMGKRLFVPSDAIASEGTVHDLAFISSVVVMSSIWSSNIHMSYDKATQLYAHVFCLLDGLRAANLGAMRIDEHLIFSGFGRNDYYSSKVVVSRLSEFCAYDRVAITLNTECRLRKLREYKQEHFKRLKLDVQAALKIGAFRNSYYKSHLHLIKNPESPFLLSSLACKLIYIATSVSPIRYFLRRIYSSLNPGKNLADVDALV